jgi:hypothetical protein
MRPGWPNTQTRWSKGVGDRSDLILVAQSLAGFTAPLVCDRLPVTLLVLLAAMVPRPGESAGDWLANTGHVFPEPFDPAVIFAHDLPPDLAAESLAHVRRQSDTPFEKPWPLDAWPDVPTRFLCAVTTASFQPTSNAGSCASGSGSPLTRWAAVTCPPWPVPRSSWSDSRPTHRMSPAPLI